MSSLPIPDTLDQWSSLARLSQLLARTVERQPEYFAALTPAKLAEPLDAQMVDAELVALPIDNDASAATVIPEGEAMRALRQARNRLQCRIIARDMTGLAAVPTTLREISRLAECLIERAYRLAYAMVSQRHGHPVFPASVSVSASLSTPESMPEQASGEPMHLTLLGMGKLGGCELNFSSDVDLIGIYPAPGTTDGRKPLSHEEFFRRVIQKLIKLLSEITPDGFVYRTDFRLRPFGETGPLVCSAEAFEHYYQVHGREWERYALIKARPIAGDRALGEEVLQAIRPFIYRRYLDYSAFASLREMKRLIADQVAKKGLADNIKLGHGGIREIEFIAQAYQLIYGGQQPALRTPSLYAVLDVLADFSPLSDDDVRALRAAYEALRKVENQLQNWDDQQTQAMPTDADQQTRLATVMGFPNYAALSTWLVTHREVVTKHFETLFFDDMPGNAGGEIPASSLVGFIPQLVSADGFSSLWKDEIEVDAEIAEWLRSIGLQAADAGVKPLVTLLKSRRFRSISRKAQQLLLSSLPGLIAHINETTSGQADATLLGIVFARVVALLQRICSRTTYLSLLNESILVRQQIVDIARRSEWLIDYIAAHPAVMDELIGNAEGYEMQSWSAMAGELDQMLVNAGNDPEHQLDSVRQFKQAKLFQIAVSDVAEQLTLMQVSDQLTQLAEVILTKEVALSAAEVQQRHGQPIMPDGTTAELGVIAFGKLGGIELGYGSDLDVVFIHSSEGVNAMTDGAKPISHGEYFAKVTRKLITRLSAATVIGNLYEVDTRLRPSGNAGVMVTSLSEFARYQQAQAWTWEHQALCRARAVVGSASIRQRFEAIRTKVLTMPVAVASLKAEVVEMRQKMFAELAPKSTTVFDLKHSRGGMVDIEFLVQFWLLAHAHEHPEIVLYSDNVRQIEALATAAIISAETAESLTKAYLQLRERAHANKLFARHYESTVTVDHREYQTMVAHITAVQTIWQTVLD